MRPAGSQRMAGIITVSLKPTSGNPGFKRIKQAAKRIANIRCDLRGKDMKKDDIVQLNIEDHECRGKRHRQSWMGYALFVKDACDRGRDRKPRVMKMKKNYGYGQADAAS